ncbi:hypothetical protein VTK26DRAFT_5911 [Humicola hyalothermophila]
MEPNSEPAEISDTIVVGGNYSDESHDESDGSIDYGEGEEGQEQEKVEPAATNDDYARTFDSPAADEDQSEAVEPQPDVSKASESMNNSSAPEPLTSQSPAAAAPSSDHPSPTPPPGSAPTSGPAPATSEPSEQAGVSEKPPEPLSAAPNASPSSAAAPAEQPRASPAPAAAIPAPASTNEDDAAAVADIQKLVDDITAKAAATASPPIAAAQAPPVTTQAAPATTLPVSHPPSLPPKPSLPPPPANLPAIPQSHHSFQSRGPNGLAAQTVSMSTVGPGASHGAYTSPAGAPGPANEGISSLPPPPPAAFGAASHAHAHLPSAHHINIGRDASAGNFHSSHIKQLWDQFQADEKRYTSEAKWERFPEGSRIFIGNLSSERVTKREVFDVFHRFGRLAQISLKNAYGFVQYHTAAEGQAAMQGTQGIELGGRRIHLEVSRTQKKKDERDRSPDRRTPRGSRGPERFDTGDRGWKRDDYRPGRSPSPRGSGSRSGRDGPYSRDREFGGSHERRRSRSPPRYSRYGEEASYRRRSPSPHRRAPVDSDRLDLPHRFGADVPDVQILLLQEVSREFVSWVQGPFHNRGLKTDVMYLNPRFPRDAVVQRQVVEGVHAIIDLDYTAQAQGKIPLQLFIRSGGSSVRFEVYQNIDPPVAVELVLRERSQSVQSRPPPQYPPTNYSQHYPTEGAPPAGYPYQYPPQLAAPAAPVAPVAPVAQAQPAAPATTDLASMVGQLDNSALQALLASLQQNPQAPAASVQGHHAAMPTQQPAGVAPPAAAPQIDMNALLGNLRNAAAAAAPAPAPAPSYGAAPPPAYAPPVAHAGMPAAGGMGGVDTAQHVQTIIDQLKRAAQ